MGFYIADGEQRFRTPTSRERRVRKPQKKSSLASACGRSVLEACAGGYSGMSRNSEPEARRALGERLSESPARMRFTAVSAAESSWSHQQSLISIQSFSSPGPEGSQLPFPVGTEVRPQTKPLRSTGSGRLVRRCPVGEGHFLWSATRLKDLLPARGLDLASLTPRARAVCPGLASRHGPGTADLTPFPSQQLLS